ncbi:MAG TPA: prenyltransferase [Bacteroidales bacterium]|nr:prenyltransferase [Bacteroidales bacterium]HRZ76571.1 prenyltransferase [Bacteroidales bacterium]
MKRISFWFNTLRTIPQVSKEEWASLDVVSRWLVASRSAVFIMTAMSAAIGGVLAYYYTGNFNTINFLLAMVGLVFAHASNNMLNDLVDFRRGVDSGNYYRTLYGPQIVESGYLSKAAFKRYIGVSLAVAMASGLVLVYRTDINTAYLMAAGLVLLLFYTWPLKYIGLGEPTVVAVWGPLMIGGSYYVTSGGSWNWDVVLLSVVYAIGPTSVLFGKHIDKSDMDRAKRVFTLPVILGEKISRYTTIGIWFLQYALFAWMIIDGRFGLSLLIVVLALMDYIRTSRIFLKPKPSEQDPAVKTTWPLFFASHAFVYNRRFSGLLLLGLILHMLLPAPF